MQAGRNVNAGKPTKVARNLWESGVRWLLEQSIEDRVFVRMTAGGDFRVQRSALHWYGKQSTRTFVRTFFSAFLGAGQPFPCLELQLCMDTTEEPVAFADDGEGRPL